MNNRDEEIRIMSLPKMQEKFREVMGEKLNSDLVYVPSKNKSMLYEKYYQNQGYFGACIRLPLPIDPVNPERGLWGMVSNCSAKLHFESCRLDEGKWSFTWHSLEDGPFCKYAAAPTVALLKALAYQWNVEVEE